MKTNILWLAFVLMASNFAFANTENCSNIILNSKIINHAIGDKDEVESNIRSFCKEYFENIKNNEETDYGGSYKLLSLSMNDKRSNAKTIANKYCDLSNSYEARADSYQKYKESIPKEAFDAYNACIMMSNDGVKFQTDSTSVQAEQLSIMVAYGSPVNASTAELSFSVPHGVSCNWLGNNEQTVILNSGMATALECTRLNKNDAAYIKILRTNSGRIEHLSLPWVAYDDDNIPLTNKCDKPTYNLGRGVVCGIENFKYAESEECGVLEYNAGTGDVCGVDQHHHCETGACGWNSCGLIKKCDAKECRHPNCGVERYKTCQHESFGVKNYKTCRTETNGVESYKSCRNPEFGIEKCE